jgi:hypothetical protein
MSLQEKREAAFVGGLSDILSSGRCGAGCSHVRASTEHRPLSTNLIGLACSGGEHREHPHRTSLLYSHFPGCEILHLFFRQRIDLHSHAGEFEARDIFVTVTSEEVAEARS